MGKDMAKRRLPPLKALPAFEAAARHGSLSAAAQEMHLTHGAISRQVKALETHLGVPLFRRLSRRIELTEAGAALLPAVRTALDVIESSAGRIAAQPRRGPLVVSCLPTFMMRWLIPRLYDFHARYPQIEVRLAASYAPVNFARDGIDVAIRFADARPPDGIDAQAFLAEEVGPVCSPAVLERLALRRPSDLRQHALLHTETRPDAWPQWIGQSGVKGVDATKGPRFEHFYVLLEAAASGLGVAVAPQPLVAADIASGRLVAPFGFVPSGRSYGILHPSELARTHKVRTFRRWLMEATAQHAGGGPTPPKAREAGME
jgi:LysR family glycine cleavage system transcriptional activator